MHAVVDIAIKINESEISAMSNNFFSIILNKRKLHESWIIWRRPVTRVGVAK